VRWPWRRHRDEDARAALASADAAVAEETERLAEVSKVMARLAGHRKRNSFAAAMREAFGAGP
jgi:hypothetical protein